MEKNTGIIRKIDELGRVVLPIEIRTQLGLKVKDPMEIYVQGKKVILQKHANECIMCSNTNSKELSSHNGQLICRKCIKSIKNIEI